MRLIIFSSIILFLHVSRISAQWSQDPNAATQMMLGSFFNAITSDGNGGAIVIGRKDGLFVAQKVNKEGYIVWDTSLQGLTVVVPDSANDVMLGQSFLWPDGNGGAFVAYDYYDFLRILTDPEYVVIYDLDTYVQHLDASGQRILGNKGVPLSTLKGANPDDYFVASSSILALGGDGQGGIMAVWNWGEIDSTGNAVGGTYLQRINASGSIFWEDNGKQVNTFGSTKAVVDHEGCVFLVTRMRDNIGTIARAIAKINVDSQVLWMRPVPISINDLILGKFISDGLGGCYVIVPHQQSGIKAYWFDLNGNQPWGENGIVVISNINPYEFFIQDAVRHSEGGFVCAWSEFRSDSTTRGLYTQYVDSGGQRKWGETGLSISAVPSGKISVQLLKASDNQFIFLFGDLRNNTNATYAQKIDKDGVAQWLLEDVLISSTAFGGRIVSDNAGGAIASWGEFSPRIVYVQKIDKDGNLGGVVSVEERDEDQPKHFELYQSQPNPFNNETNINYALLSETQPVQLTIYDIRGKEVVTLVNQVQAKGNYVVRWAGMDKDGIRVAAGVYFYKLQIGHYHLVKKFVYVR